MAISSDHFTDACYWLKDKFEQASSIRSNWQEVKVLTLYGRTFLRIIRSLGETESQTHAVDVDASDADMDDEGMAKQDPKMFVVADVVHSVAYQVPVLYLTCQNDTSPEQMTPKGVQQMVVPDIHRPQMSTIGVVGGLSMTEHSVTGTPSYFVHPCRTADAMRSLRNDQSEIKPEEYLMRWFGVIGSSVGLSVPLEIARISSTEVDNDHDNARP